MLVLLPVVLSDFRTAQLAAVGAYLIAILGLDLLLRDTGQVSLGHGAFMAIGAYTTAILVERHGIRDLATIPIAAAVAGAVAIVLGLPALRLPGLYLALVTFGLALVFPSIPRKFDGLTGGSAGLSFFGNAQQTGGGTGVLGLSEAQWVYAVTWAVAAGLFFCMTWLVRSRFGRSLRALRDSPRAASSAGVFRSGYQLTAFGVSAAYAGIAGSLIAIASAVVTPGAIQLQVSLYLVVGAVAGLLGSIRGAVLGALLVQYLPDVVGAFPRVDSTQYGPTTFVYGVILIALVLLAPAALRVAAVVADRRR